MNASLFFPFQQLTTLSLQSINFTGDSVHNQGFDRLSSLENLESLDLSWNTFKDINNILLSIGRISSLKSLSLSYNMLNLTTVDIQGFDMMLSRLEKLESLDLRGNPNLDKSILSSISNISSLKSLYLSDIGLDSSTDIQGLSKLVNLEDLDLSGNYFNNNSTSGLLSFVSGFSTLKTLDLSDCGLEGTIDLQELDVLENLETLTLSGNKITKVVASRGLSKLVNLEDLDLSRNNFNKSTLGLLSFVSGFSTLKTLDLSVCGLKGTIDLQELDVLENLETLWLSGNQITKVVASRDIGDRVPRNLSTLFLDEITPENGSSSNVELHSLGTYPNLKTISLCGNNFEGPIFVQEEGNYFNNLEELFFNGSYLDDKSFESIKFEGMSSLKRLSFSIYDPYIYRNASRPKKKLPSLRFLNLKNLESLDLSGYYLDNNILKDIGNLISLKTLRLISCGLSGILPSSEGLCNLRNLEELYLNSNELSGTLPQCIANLTSLQMFDLPYNHFSGSISPLRSLTSLQWLDFSNNQFQVPLSLEPFFNHSKLKYLNGDDNYITYEDHVEVCDSSPKFQLETLWLSSHGNVTGTRVGFPKFLWHQHDLQSVAISNIQVKGEFPYWLLDNNTNLWFLNLANTSLSGPLHLPTHSHYYLNSLDISNNDLNGIIPIEIGQLFPNLKELQVENNKFFGNIPHSLLNCSDLRMFDASNNDLSGRIPGWIVHVSSLQVLDLSENWFFGSLPTQIGPSQIREVYLSGNMLQGSLGTSFYNCSELMTLDLSNNNFSGTIPKWIGELPKLRHLLMRHNNLEGEIPVEFCSLEQLSLIDISNNHLSGHHVLSCIRVGSKHIDLDIIFKGFNYEDVTGYMEQPLVVTTKSITLPFRGSILQYISGIDLSCNNLSGKIPAQIGNLTMIQVLNLSHNSLIGPIPESFSNLIQIESLDLSYNNLNGNIPSQLLGLTSLSAFSVAHNNLSGSTPAMVNQFGTFENTSYEGNPFLCGPPLTKSCSPIVPPTPNAEEEEEEEDEGGFMDMEAFFVSCVISYVIVLCTIGGVLYVNPYWRRRWFYMIEVRLANCYYFIEDNLLFPLFNFRAS